MGCEIFISYSRNDKSVVLPFVKQIGEAVGRNCWIDLKGIESGVEFEEVIIKAIDDCQVVLFMLSDSSLRSKWTKREVIYAEGEGKHIVPVIVEGNRLRGWFKFHFGNVDFIDIRSEEQKQKLVSNLRMWLGVEEEEVRRNATEAALLEAGQNKKNKLKRKIMHCFRHYWYLPLCLLIMCLFIFFLPPSDEKVIANALECYNQGEYRTARDYFLKLAEKGNPEAQNYLGRMYDEGHGVKQSDKDAVEWYRKAAGQGYAAAQFNLGKMYANGRGVLQSDKDAVEWYRKAAEQGDSTAQCNLGYMYDLGRGVLQSDKDAVKWYRKAAEQGDAYAQYNLGLMYAEGRGVQQSDKDAVEWYRKAAEQGYASAQNNLGFMFVKGRGVQQSDKDAVEWYRKAAEQGYAYAQYNLGFMYAEGRGVQQSDKEAVKWYRKAAEQGYASAQYNLGLMYAEGRGVQQSDKEAVEWYRKAAGQGFTDAKDRLKTIGMKKSEK